MRHATAAMPCCRKFFFKPGDGWTDRLGIAIPAGPIDNVRTLLHVRTVCFVLCHLLYHQQPALLLQPVLWARLLATAA